MWGCKYGMGMDGMGRGGTSWGRSKSTALQPSHQQGVRGGSKFTVLQPSRLTLNGSG